MSYFGSLDEARRDISRVECPTVTPTDPHTTSPVLAGSGDGGGLDGSGMSGTLEPRNYKVKQSAASGKMRRTYGLDHSTKNA